MLFEVCGVPGVREMSSDLDSEVLGAAAASRSADAFHVEAFKLSISLSPLPSFFNSSSPLIKRNEDATHKITPNAQTDLARRARRVGRAAHDTGGPARVGRDERIHSVAHRGMCV